MIVKKTSILFFLFISFFTLSISLDGQILDPVKIESNFMKIDDSTFVIKFDAVIDEHWHVYSHYIKEGGPVPSSIVIESMENIEPTDSIKEIGKIKEEHDPNFDMNVYYHTGDIKLSLSFSTSTNAQYGERDLNFGLVGRSRRRPGNPGRYGPGRLPGRRGPSTRRLRIRPVGSERLGVRPPA